MVTKKLIIKEVVDEVVASLKNDPYMWRYGNKHLYMKIGKHFYSHVVFDYYIMKHFVNGVEILHVRDIPLKYSIRLRYAIWKWKKLGIKSNDK